MNEKTAVLDMHGFGCGSCAYAIERFGRKLDGIHDIRVDLAAHEIRVCYDPDQIDAPTRIIEHVRAIGHDASLQSS